MSVQAHALNNSVVSNAINEDAATRVDKSVAVPLDVVHDPLEDRRAPLLEFHLRPLADLPHAHPDNPLSRHKVVWHAVVQPCRREPDLVCQADALLDLAAPLSSQHALQQVRLGRAPRVVVCPLQKLFWLRPLPGLFDGGGFLLLFFTRL